jgi:hypothetical protein
MRTKVQTALKKCLDDAELNITDPVCSALEKKASSTRTVSDRPGHQGIFQRFRTTHATTKRIDRLDYNGWLSHGGFIERVFSDANYHSNSDNGICCLWLHTHTFIF